MDKVSKKQDFRRAAMALTLAATTFWTSSPTLAQTSSAQPDQGSAAQERYSVPPPPGYQPGNDQDETSAQSRADDERYSYEAERWAAQYCVAHRANDTAAGVVIGGILGAIIGGSVSGRYDRGAGVVAGGALGAMAGGAIGSTASSNPNCPPGYVLAPDAAPFLPGPVYGDVIYAAPAWYDPWIWYGRHWIYRPYPYHRYWYRAHRQ